MKRQFDVFPDQMEQQVLHALGDVVEGKQAGFAIRGPGHDQQLPNQAGRLHTGAADFFGILADAIARL